VTHIRGGLLATGDRLRPGDLHISDGLIVEEGGGGGEVEADGLKVAPGLIDIQINGGSGQTTQDPTTIWEVGGRLPALGVTSFVPTVVTSPGHVSDLALDVVANRRPDRYRGADVIGLHFEGPWISPSMYGAHNPAHIVDPDPDVATRWANSGLVRIVTLAPERPGADRVAKILSDAGVVVSLGHTEADFDTARGAWPDCLLVTHLFSK
jgi:N-acetylglucosamine-6-phosphate deacetylase